MMEVALINLLIADAGVSALVGTRVTPLERAQGSDLPAVVLHRIGGDRGYDDVGRTGLVDSRVQVDCWGKTWLAAKELAAAVIVVLGDFDGTTGGVAFDGVFLESERDLPETGGGKSEYLHRTSLDFNVWHSE